MASNGTATLKDILPVLWRLAVVISCQNREIFNQMSKGLTYRPGSAYNRAPDPVFENIRMYVMANHKSAKKRIIRNANRALVNGARLSRIRTFVKKVEAAIASGDATAARDALRAAQPELQRGVSRGVLHKNTASRKISRLASRVKALAA